MGTGAQGRAGAEAGLGVWVGEERGVEAGEEHRRSERIVGPWIIIGCDPDFAKCTAIFPRCSHIARSLAFHEDGPTAALELLGNPRDSEVRLRGLGRTPRDTGGAAIFLGDVRRAGNRQRRRRTERRLARRDRRIRQSNGEFSTDDKDTRQRSPTLYFALDDQGTSQLRVVAFGRLPGS
ncbi:hypothetical protein KM043_008273 [Ampulex compressa]|nr:hypothetical protein KM043_008273 [Ampulex compressa]